jgi:Ca-activated chloride channel family protein
MSPLPSYYDVLGIPKDATPAEIRHAYRELSRKFHPDVNPKQGGTTQFLNIHQAYETLSQTEQREEYDKQLAEQNKDPVSIEITYSRSLLPALEEPQLYYAHLEITPTPHFASNSKPSLNLCMIIDRSTSMQGTRLDRVRSAAIEVIRKIERDDILSIVTFSDRAEILLPAERRNEYQSAETQIRLMRASGGTEIFQGLEAGFQQITRNLNRSRVNHIFLITDGHTYGDEEACMELASRAALQGIRITALGIGTEWNDQFLDDLTHRTGGNTYYISEESNLRELVQEKFTNLNLIFADHVSLKIQPSEGVSFNSIYRLRPDSAQLTLSDSIHLGSILKSTGLSMLIEMMIQPLDPHPYRRSLAEGILNLFLPIELETTYNLPVQLSRLVGKPEINEKPPTQIMQALTHITLYRMQERARREVTEGKTEAASMRLQRLATQLFSIGEIEMAKTALMEADRIKQTRTLSAEGEKYMKYASRALLLPGSDEMERTK